MVVRASDYPIPIRNRPLPPLPYAVRRRLGRPKAVQAQAQAPAGPLAAFLLAVDFIFFSVLISLVLIIVLVQF